MTIRDLKKATHQAWKQSGLPVKRGMPAPAPANIRKAVNACTEIINTFSNQGDITENEINEILTKLLEEWNLEG